MLKESFMFGDWLVQEQANLLRRDTETQALEPLVMSVLVALCERPGEVVSADDLLRRCWKDAAVGDNPVHKTIAILRRALGDQATEPRYIETIRKKGYRTVAAVQAATTVGAGSWTQGSPFLGLSSFNADHAAVFHGRRRAIEKLLTGLVQLKKSARELVLILGPSGSGKTSLVQAGLLPALSRPDSPLRVVSATCLDLADLGAQNAFVAIASAMLDWEIDGKPIFSGRSADNLGRSLQVSPELVDTEIRQALQNFPESRFALFLDRLEVLFSHPQIDSVTRALILALIDRLATSSRVLVISACRNDFYPQLAAEPLLMANKEHGGHFDLAPPTRAELAQMIRLPAIAAGLSFGVDPETHARVDDLLCESAATSPDALPLLQYTLHELYCQRSRTGELQAQVLSQLGGLEGAIGKRAETVVARLSDAERDSLPDVLSLLVTFVDDETIASRRAPWSALTTAEQRTLVTVLVEQRLFVSTLVGDAPGFGVAHEALLRRWPRVSQWIASHRQALHLRGRLATQAGRWIADNRSQDLLIPSGKQLAESLELRKDSSIALDTDTLSLIEASRSRDARLHRIQRGVMAAIVALAVLSSILGISAFHAQRQAEAEARRASAVSDFLGKDLFSSVSSGNTPAKDITVPEMLGKAGLLVDKRFAAEPLIAAEVHATLGRAFYQLYLDDQARAHFRSALTLREQENLAGTEDSVVLASSLVELDQEAKELSHTQADYEHVLKQATDRLGQHNTAVIKLRINLAWARYWDGNWKAADSELRSLESLMSPDSRADKTLLAEIEWKLGWISCDMSDFAEAERTLKASLEHLAGAVAPDHIDMVRARTAMGRLHLEQSRYAEAERELTDSLDRARQWGTDNSWDVLRPEYLLARLYAERDGTIRFESEISTGISTPDPSVVQLDIGDAAREVLAELYGREQRWDKAEKFLRTAADISSRNHGADNVMARKFRIDLAQVLITERRVDEAQAVLNTPDPIAFKDLPAAHPYQAQLLYVLAQIAGARNDLALERRLLTESLADFSRTYGAEYWRSQKVRDLLSNLPR